MKRPPCSTGARFSASGVQPARVPRVTHRLAVPVRWCHERQLVGVKNRITPSGLQKARLLPVSGFLRPVDADRDTDEPAHIFAIAARLMRQILVDHARRKRADTRGGGAAVISLDEVDAAAAQTSGVDMLALDEVLDALASFDARQCRVVKSNLEALAAAKRSIELNQTSAVGHTALACATLL